MIPRSFGFAVLAFVLVATGCGKKDGAAELPSYTVRGAIVSVSTKEIVIHHEAIPNFVAHSGKVAPMMSMSMPFGRGPKLDTSEVAAGDVVSFTFEVDFERNPPSRVISLQKLPSGTPLTLSGH